MRADDRTAHLISAALVALAALAWWSTVSSTSAARIAAMQPIEAYAFAVHEQLMWNFADSGEFFQTIHKGYDDAWTWSGHRALTLPVTALLYGLDPSPWWLARLLIAGVLSGVIPAALIGRRALGSGWGIALGGLIYLTAPVNALLALQDYQDLVFALPALTWALCAMGARGWWWAPLGAAVAVMPREECVPLAVAAALVAVRWRKTGGRLPRPDWLPWLRTIALTAAVAGGYAVWAEARFPIATSGHDMPLANAVGFLLDGPPNLFLDGWPFWSRFYAVMFVPLGFLAMLSPLTVAPAIALIALHLTVPHGHGVDRSWSGHAHHMAPAMAFLTVATIEGAGRLLRLCGAHLGRRAAAGLGVIAIAYAAGSSVQWAGHYNLVRTPIPTAPEWAHPVWYLAGELTADDVPIVPREASIAASARTRSYSYDGSLTTKAPRKGLGAGNVMIADTRQSGVVEWGLSMAGAEIVAERSPYVMIRWSAGAVDRAWMSWRGARFDRASPWLGGARTRGELAGVPPFESGQLPADRSEIPRIRLRW